MRKMLALSLTVVTLTLGVPAGVSAQLVAGAVQSTLGVASISGQVVDAGGRGIPAQRVELLQGSVVVQTTTTDARGQYAFARVADGDFIVRVVANGIPAGIRVPVGGGAAVTGATIVLPSAAAPSGLSGGWIAGGILTVVAIIGIIAVSVNNNDDDDS